MQQNAEWTTGGLALDGLVCFIPSIRKMKCRQLGMVYCCTGSFVSERDFSFLVSKRDLTKIHSQEPVYLE